MVSDYKKIFIGILLVLLTWSCAPEKPVFEPEPVDVPPLFLRVDESRVMDIIKDGIKAQGLESWQDLSPAVEKSLRYVRTRNPYRTAVCEPDLCVTWKELSETLELFYSLLPDLDRDQGLLKHYFNFYAVNPDILLTGYYEPLLRASPEPHEDYPYPVYSRPEDLHTLELSEFHPRWSGQSLVYRLEGQRVLPYYERREIDSQGVLKDRDLEIAWVEDAVDLFFLHIQGSGRLEYSGGHTEHVLYAGRNGRQYVALGRVMVEKGYLEPEEVSMQSIRAFLNENPEMKNELMALNPSYIFFQLSDSGPYGSIGQLLTPWVSVASDPSLVPWGSLLILNAKLPEYQGIKTRVSGPVLAQDTGGAIRGRHLDLFCGFGDRAQNLAGMMKGRAEVYLMVRKHDPN